MRRTVLSGVLILGLVALLFSGIEVGARLLGPQFLPPDSSNQLEPGQSRPGEPNLVGDARLGWRVKAGRNREFGVPAVTEVNSRGLRGPELSLEPGGQRRIVVVGDSSIYGVRVRDQDTISGQLSQLLQRVDPNIAVLNGGCPGYSTWQVKRLLKEQLLAYQPEWVILGALWSDTQGADQPDATQFGGEMLAWRYHSRAYVLLRLWQQQRRWKTEAPAPVSHGLMPMLAPTNRVPIEDYERNLQELISMIKGAGAKPAFLLLPGIRDVEAGVTGDFREGYRQVMRAIAIEHQLPIADMPKHFVGMNAQATFYDDVHPQPIGYRKIALELERVLLSSPHWN